MRTSAVVCLVLAASALPASALAQANGGLASLLPDLILKGITLPGNDNPGAPHAGHFTLGDPTFGGSQQGSRADIDAVAAVEAFADRLRAQLANVPLGSSTGGFTYTFDVDSGIYTRSSRSFGPAFTERATTVGRRRLSLGASYQHMAFDTFGGLNLRDGSIVFYLPHTDCCPPGRTGTSPQEPGLETDVVQAAVHLNASTGTLAFFANYGLTDRLDVGIAVPLTHVVVEADIRATILRLSTGANVRVHTFVEGEDVIGTTFSQRGSATGLGDLVVRTKYNFLRAAAAGLAVALDLRLPTGNEDDLLGVGTTQGKIFFVASSAHASGRISPHVNVGYTASGEGARRAGLVFEPLGASDEVNYAGGVEITPHPRITVVADLVGRTLLDAGTLALETRTFPFRQGALADAGAPLQTSTINPVTGDPYRQPAHRPGNLSLLLGSTGFKLNVLANLLVTANVLFPLTDAGLRDRLAVALGLDYAF